MLGWLWRLLRLPLFLVLYWLRQPIVGLCNLVFAPVLLAFLAGVVFIDAASAHRPVVWAFGDLSFAACALARLYDLILMVLAPEDLVIGL